jgi:hypothetical protein
MSSIAGLLRLASVVICLIVLVAFGVFAADQAKGASTHQQQALAKGAASNTNGEDPSESATSTAHESGLHKALDEASNTFTSPFSGVISSNSPWAVHGVELLLALVVYGFGLGFLARVLQGRN